MARTCILQHSTVSATLTNARTHPRTYTMPPTASSSSTSASNQWAHLSLVEVLEDLSSRFIVNLPKEELQSIHRICFQVEQAHWFYEDFLRPLNDSLPSLNLRRFSIYLLQTASLSVPLIRQYVSSDNAQDPGSTTTVQDLNTLGDATYGLEAAFDEFLKYKTRVPVCGVILVSQDWQSCLLVKGWKSSAAWGFPKGKINQSESHRDCAVRETFEETGYDCAHLLPPDSPHWFELNVREQKMRLYIVPGVPHDTVFETQTRKEISKIAWFKMSDLPTWKQAQGGGLASANAGAKFYLVTPFVGKLKQWVKENKKKPGVAAAQNTNGQVAQQTAAEKTTTATTTTTKTTPQGPSPTPSAPLFSDANSAWPLARAQQQPPQPQTQPSSAPKDDFMQLSMVVGPHPLYTEERSRVHASPLLAPRPQKSSSQAVKLLDMLSPGAANGRGANQEEAQRAQKRDALLSQLMGGGGGGGGGFHPQNTTPQQHMSGQALLNTLMNTPQPSHPPVPSPAPQPFVNGTHAPHPPQAPAHSSPDAGRAGLLAMLNAGPMVPPQHHVNGHHQQPQHAHYPHFAPPPPTPWHHQMSPQHPHAYPVHSHPAHPGYYHSPQPAPPHMPPFYQQQQQPYHQPPGPAPAPPTAPPPAGGSNNGSLLALLNGRG